jgi:F0F1-type ATP synthase epsilon subunit
MSCYFRHMKDVLEEAGVQVTKENKQEIDKIVHGIVDVDYKNCPAAWKTIKERTKTDEKERRRFIERLKREMKA